MENEISTLHQRQLLADLYGLIEERSRAEQEIEQNANAQVQQLKARADAEQKRLSHESLRQLDTVEAEYQKLLADAKARFEGELDALAREKEDLLEQAAQAKTNAISDGEYDWFISRQRLRKDHQKQKQATADAYKRRKAELAELGRELHELREQTTLVLERHRSSLPESAPTGATPSDDEDYVGQFRQCVRQIENATEQFRRRPPVRFMEERWTILVFFFAAILFVYPAGLLFSWRLPAIPLVVAGFAAVGTAIIAWQVGRFLARRDAEDVAPQLATSFMGAGDALASADGQAKEAAERKLKELSRQNKQQIKDLDAQWKANLANLHAQQQRRQTELNEWHVAGEAAIRQRWDATVAPVRDKYEPRLAEIRRQVEDQTQRIRAEHDSQLRAVQADAQHRWRSLIDRWIDGVTEFARSADEMNRVCDQSCGDLSCIDWSTWQPPEEALPALRFGSCCVDLSEIEHGVSADPRLELPCSKFYCPAVLTFPQAPSLLLEAEGEGRAESVRAMQNIMLRLLTNLPPGKVRFTIIDPTGLGQNFSALMHLADYDERLVTNRIWTESSHINQRLTDLTEHMENVIQTYLRNEFDSIQQYNHHAGEVAEPFHVLVVANFPTNFTEEAARRLVSIASSGARCGVYTLIGVDTKMKLPRNFDLADLETNAGTVEWRQDAFYWKYDEFRQFPITLDAPPEDRDVTAALHAVGEMAKVANRVEVPFAAVVPEPSEYWTGDSRTEIQVPLGRAGATKLQSLQLGKGTSQHVLISGKTGSGKSTLLHAMITNLAVRYSPDEIQFYLVDFKKGVEFKAYAEQRLPHARVIAIESEREFGMSVLERLDVELRRRGDLFRRVGVQDLAGYRDARPDERMPRVLLVIDEFQEFFVKEDRIAQDASLLLDRLVRQGRAFGIHVLLGSQTLAGAYSLARSTIGQMAVRIALQCSAGDAHLILSEENDAARLLRRPGEAIYNDANGLFEGNHPFQVVWLPDHEKEDYLRQLREMCAARGVAVDPPVVFEGNVAADPAANRLLRKALESPAPEETPLAPRAWVGEAIAIKEPPAVVFHRRSGSNLLLVGQHEESALGVMANCAVSLAAFSSRVGDDKGTRFVILDGTRPESNQAGLWRQVADALPLDVSLVKPREAAGAVGRLAIEVQRRLDSEEDTGQPIFLILYNLARFRALQRAEDDFGFGSLSSDTPPSAAAQLNTVLREGPTHGVHTLLWSDSFSNTMRWLDRQTLPDFELRILFQMSSTDSSNLMDSPGAAHLGTHRAILYSEDQSRAERFRPYSQPTADWLSQVRRWLQDRQITRNQADEHGFK